jgi:signal transduction histidine kinase
MSFEAAPEVLVMRPLINQVFSNIIENAVKYASNQSTISISGRHDPLSDCVSVQVTNFGIPLPTEVNRVFERGYRSDAAKNKYPAGTGFGLYIAKRIVEIHQGKIQAATTNRGAITFAVALSVRGLEGKTRTRDPKDRSPNRR